MTAYGTALGSLVRDRITVCIPGTYEGEPVVSILSWPMSTEARQDLYHPNPDIRACFLFGVCQAARQTAREEGVTV